MNVRGPTMPHPWLAGSHSKADSQIADSLVQLKPFRPFRVTHLVESLGWFFSSAFEKTLAQSASLFWRWGRQQPPPRLENRFPHPSSCDSDPRCQLLPWRQLGDHQLWIYVKRWSL